jgi:4-hydroxybenzoate polyprenyltransferase
MGRVSVPLGYVQWLVLGVIGLVLAFAVNVPVGLASAALWFMGIVYNTPPIRLKDRAYLDVLSESINNPLRLAVGWHACGTLKPPTLSVVVAYWMFGAFMMAVKRFAEMRHIGDDAVAADYRLSFGYYNQPRLQMSILFYAALFGMFSGIFIARYRTELVLATPLVCIALAYYLRVGHRRNSLVQHPEKLYREPKLMVLVGLAFAACALLLFVDVPIVREFFRPGFDTSSMAP